MPDLSHYLSIVVSCLTAIKINVARQIELIIPYKTRPYGAYYNATSVVI